MRHRAQHALQVIYFSKETTIREDGSASSEEVGMEMSLAGTLSSTGTTLKMSRAGVA